MGVKLGGPNFTGGSGGKLAAPPASALGREQNFGPVGTAGATSPALSGGALQCGAVVNNQGGNPVGGGAAPAPGASAFGYQKSYGPPGTAGATSPVKSGGSLQTGPGLANGKG